MKKISMRIASGPIAAVAGITVAATLLAACGGSGGTSPAAAAASPSASASGGSASAYRDCLAQHGVAFPSRSPGEGRSFGTPGGGGFGGGGGGGFGGGGGGFSVSPQTRAALQACASLRPNGGFGGFGGRGGTALVAFRNCMSQQGVAIPTTRPTAPPTARPTANPGAARFLGGLDPSDPKVAAALRVCSPLLPTRSPSASPTG
jgi:hypothetical protein